MGGKNASSPKLRSGKQVNRSTPAKPAPSQSPKPMSNRKTRSSASKTKATTPRVRRRASDFASKSRSAKKRPRETVEDADDVDKILHNLREAVDSGTADGNAPVSEGLLNAIKHARDAEENDESGISSSSEEPEECEDRNEGRHALQDDGRVKQNGIQSEGKPMENSKGSLGTSLKNAEGTHRKGPESSPKAGRADTGNANGEKACAVTPMRTESKSAKKSRSTPKKNHSKGNESKNSGLNIKTASAHKRDIEALKQDDPEFYKFLEENDATLLDFDDEDEFEESDDAQEDEGDIADNIDEIGAAGGRNNTHGTRTDEGDDDGHKDEHKDNIASDVEEDQSEYEGSDDDDAPVDISKAAVEDVHGYSDEDEDDDEGAEAEAAAEAGLELNGSESGGEDGDEDDDADDGEAGDEISGKSDASKSRKMIVVDMSYLRNVKDQLRSNRSSLKATKELLRLFRAGKDILPGQSASKDKRTKIRKKGSRKHDQDEIPEQDVDDIEDDHFADDGSFTSGKVRFASARAYQQAMNLAIIGVQDALDRMLGKPEPKKGSSERQLSKWDPSASGRWLNLQPVFRSYVFHMLSLCDVVADPATSRFLLKRLERLVPYTKGNKILLKKIIRIAVRVWSADSLHISEATRLRAYLLLNKLAHGAGNAEAVLRSCCSVYASSVANVCNPRTLPRIHFATTCIVELFGVDMGASYTTAFANLREMAISLRAVLVSKEEKDEVERIHNWSYINRIRLWSKVLGKYGSEDELRPLIYPYVQVSLGVMRVHATPRTFPLRLHVASYLSDLVAQTGTFVPLAPHLLLLLRCSEFRKKPRHGSTKALEWRSILRVSSDAIKTKPFLTGVLNGVILHLAEYFGIISRHVSFPEVVHVAEVALRKFAKEVVVVEWKSKVMALVEKLRQTSELIMETRATADFSPQGAVSPEGMLGCVPGIDREKKTPIERFYEVEAARIEGEEKLRDEKIHSKPGKAAAAAEDVEDVSAEDDRDAEAEPARKRAKRSKPVKRKQPAKIGRPPLSIMDLDDNQDVLQALTIDSDDSEEEQ